MGQMKREGKGHATFVLPFAPKSGCRLPIWGRGSCPFAPKWVQFVPWILGSFIHQTNGLEMRRLVRYVQILIKYYLFSNYCEFIVNSLNLPSVLFHQILRFQPSVSPKVQRHYSILNSI
jgi:hypothetical protein